MNSILHLQAIVASLPTESSEHSFFDAWQSMSDQLGLNSEAGVETLVVLTRDITAKESGDLDPAFGGGWKWDLRKGFLKATASSVLLCSTLAAAGCNLDISSLLIPAVIPLLFELDRVKLSREDRSVLRIIGCRPDIQTRSGNSDQLYDSLPDAIKSTFAREQMPLILEAAVQAGVTLEKAGVFEVLQNGECTFKISIE